MYATYSAVPWYRKSSFVSLFTLVGLVFLPAVLAVCILVLTGEVYYNEVDVAGKLKVWSFGNKIAAVLILILSCLWTAYVFGAFG